LIEAAMREGESRHWKYLELRGGHELLSDLPQSVSYYGHKLNLKLPTQEIFQRFEGSVQRAIRKAERSEVTVRFAANIKAVEDYYRLHCRTRMKHGAPPQPFRFFRSLCENVLQKGRGFVALAMHHDRPIAGAVFLEFRGKVIYKFAASDERYQEYRGSNLVVWKSIQKLIESGASELILGKTALSNDGLRRFKSGWGAEEYIVQYARYCFEHRAYVKLSDLAAGPQARVFSLMPAFVLRWIGRAAYPHMS
jgi:lipid II:glycine glycyltransferase (peptidoglycan interpeptide bridge formation enzyme)